jgi:hypothetical protein
VIKFQLNRTRFKHLKPGDWLVLLLAVLACLAIAWQQWQGGAPDTAVIRVNGQVVKRTDLRRPQRLEVQGALGVSRIEIQPGRARVAADPGPRQYCVRQGWISRSGAVAICAPNHVTLSLEGGRGAYDTLGY